MTGLVEVASTVEDTTYCEREEWGSWKLLAGMALGAELHRAGTICIADALNARAAAAEALDEETYLRAIGG